MSDYAMADFMARFAGGTRHELAASDSETWRVSDLLGLATEQDRARFEQLKLAYTDPHGSESLRASIAATYRGIAASAVIATQGAQDALSLAFEALLTRDDHAILLLPNYPPTEHDLLTRCAVTGVALDSERGWALDLAQVAAAIRPNTKLLVANFPNNPTGKLLSLPELDALIALCRAHNIVLINDEVYRLIDRDPHRRLPCVAEMYERGISIDAVSKSLGLPGLRIGWLATRDVGIRAKILRAQQWRSSCPSGPAEILAEIALSARDLLLARNRAIALSNLIGVEGFLDLHSQRFSWTRPEGSVVGYVRYHGTEGVEAFAATLARTRATLIFPASIWRSKLAALPDDHFRLGFGRRDCLAALGALGQTVSSPG
jgi:aspartate/methionine/tyrosine aminotransferase